MHCHSCVKANPKPAIKLRPLPVKRVRVGFIALADFAPLLVAESLGLFSKYNIEVELVREVGWATVREKILYGQLDAAHAIAGLALSMRLGLDGVTCNTIAPFVFNLNGNAITLARDLWLRGVRDAVTLNKLIRSTPQRLFTFGIVSRVSSHNFLLRRWLKQGGIDPDKDVRLVVLPPTQMVGALTAGLIDGYCVGEPWNSVAIMNGTGWCPASSEDLAPNHPEKILLTTEEFADERPLELKALIQALYEACAFCDAEENREQVLSLLMGSGQLQAERSALKASLIGPFDTGTGNKRNATRFHIFHRENANVPDASKARWIVNQFAEHGLIPQHDVTAAMETAASCWREDIFFQAIESNRASGTRRKTSSKLRLQTSLSAEMTAGSFQFPIVAA